jgi:hypothetical protein
VKRALLRPACALLLAGAPLLAAADIGSQQGGGSQTASADLDFQIDIGKFIFFRVGTGGYPTASGTVDTVTFNTAFTIPPGAVTPANGNNTTVNWNGALPTFTAPTTTLPVEVRSNAGQITIRANVVTPLVSGSNSIPLSQIVLSTSDANLPAPVIPNTGTGASVNVVGTAFTNLVTQRTANWTFAYTPLTTQAAGNYTGQISFTASSP